MKYDQMQEGIFLKRPNRFLARVMVGETEETCHVKNTGRCTELLIPGATAYVQHHNNPNRKTQYSLIAIKKGHCLVNIDSQAPNKVVGEWLRLGKFRDDITLIKPECKYKNSRFDFYLETKAHKIFIEVKGVTLEEDGVAMFPDAPTERGVKHIGELIEARNEGYGAAIIFVIQMKGVASFKPHDQMHKAFGDMLRKAHEAGVQIYAYDCLVTKDSLAIDKSIPVNLGMDE